MLDIDLSTCKKSKPGYYNILIETLFLWFSWPKKKEWPWFDKEETYVSTICSALGNPVRPWSTMLPVGQIYSWNAMIEWDIELNLPAITSLGF